MSPVRHKVPISTFFAAFVYKVPSWQSVPRLERIKTEFDEYLNSANNNFNDVIKIKPFPGAKHN